MRTVLALIAATAGLMVAAVAVAAAAPADGSETAVWQPRKLHNFTLPLVVNSENGPLQEASCDQLYTTVTALLRQLGARDVKVDQRGCHAYTINRSIDVTFSVLAPVSKVVNRERFGPAVDAHWQTVQLGGNCLYLQGVTQKVLPSFSTRNVKLISAADCERLGVGLFGQVLRAPDETASQ